MIASIHEYKGKQELYIENYSDILEKMIDVAKIQNTRSSNAIEGIYTKDSRLRELMKKKAEPKNRKEEEIAGYRHVLDIVHENYEYIEFNKNDILTLHNQLYSYSHINHKGKFKTVDNTIVLDNRINEQNKSCRRRLNSRSNWLRAKKKQSFSTRQPIRS